MPMNERDEFNAVNAAEDLFKKNADVRIDINKDYVVQIPLGAVVVLGASFGVANAWMGNISGADDESIHKDLLDRFISGRKSVYPIETPRGVSSNQPIPVRLNYGLIDFMRKSYLHSAFPFKDINPKGFVIKQLNMLLDVNAAFVEAGGANNTELIDEINDELVKLD